MELPHREQGDMLLRPGEMTKLRERLRGISGRHNLSSVIAYSFVHRTRTLHLQYADTRMAPAGVRAIGSAMVDIGFPKTRIVLQQWNRNFRPTHMRLDGRLPDMFMVSSLWVHSAMCEELIRDACRIDPPHRPLIIAGGPKLFYEPWSVFSSDPADPWGTDVAVTGEEYVLLSLLEVLLSFRAPDEPMRSAFLRARDCGALDEVPGLVYPRTDAKGNVEELVDTGIQRLLGDLDELPHPVLGYGLLEPPSDMRGLSAKAIPAGQVRKHTRIGSIVLTQGCRFNCSFCPISAYNQGHVRAKSAARVTDEIAQISYRYGIKLYFGADDNFFADSRYVTEVAESMARAVESDAFRGVAWSTEATVHDTLKVKDQLSTLRRGGLVQLWLGVEDMSGSVVKKGQSGDRTLEAFSILRRNGISPAPMLIYHDGQPLFSWRSRHGLLNQLRLLRKAGAIIMQVLAFTPALGSKDYEENYTSGWVFKSVGGVPVEPVLSDGLYVMASSHSRPWTRQLNLLVAYAFFYNPFRLLGAILHSKSKLPSEDKPSWSGNTKWQRFRRRLTWRVSTYLADALMQMVGMGALLGMIRQTSGWMIMLMRGRIERHSGPPISRIPMRNPSGGQASHAIPGTPIPFVSTKASRTQDLQN